MALYRVLVEKDGEKEEVRTHISGNKLGAYWLAHSFDKYK